MAPLGKKSFLMAWNLAGFAGHQWSYVDWPSMLDPSQHGAEDYWHRRAFEEHFNSLTAKEWSELARSMTYLHTTPGAVGWGIVAPEHEGDSLVVRVGAGVKGVFSPEGHYAVTYENPHRGICISIKDGRFAESEGPLAPRDWARIVRLAVEIEADPYAPIERRFPPSLEDFEPPGYLAYYIPKEVLASEEFRSYYRSSNAGHLLAGPQPISEVQRNSGEPDI